MQRAEKDVCSSTEENQRSLRSRRGNGTGTISHGSIKIRLDIGLRRWIDRRDRSSADVARLHLIDPRRCPKTIGFIGQPSTCRSARGWHDLFFTYL